MTYLNDDSNISMCIFILKLTSYIFRAFIFLFNKHYRLIFYHGFYNVQISGQKTSLIEPSPLDILLQILVEPS